MIVCNRSVQWEVVVPLGLEWGFMKAFGEAFRIKDPIDGTNFIKSVDGYKEDRDGWRIRVSVDAVEELRLGQFCEDFFALHRIAFCKPEQRQAPSFTQVSAKPDGVASDLFTPAGRKAIAEAITQAVAAASRSEEMEDRDPSSAVIYTTDGETIFSNGDPMTDEEAFRTFKVVQATVLGRGF